MKYGGYRHQHIDTNNNLRKWHWFVSYTEHAFYQKWQKKIPLLWEKSGGPPILCTKNSYWFWIASSFLEFANMERNHSSSSSS